MEDVGSIESKDLLGCPFLSAAPVIRQLETEVPRKMERNSILTNSSFVRRIVRAGGIFLALNVIWEGSQLPFYTLWMEGSWGEIAYAVGHCTLGDGLIGLVTILIAAALVRLAGRSSPLFSAEMLIVFLPIGLAYTVFSEWVNVHVRESWAYSPLMPLVPPLGTGLTPLLQWIIVPVLTWVMAGGPVRSRLRGQPPAD